MIVGQKDDEGKARTDLLPPKAILEVCRILGHGAAKYTDNGYREVKQPTRRYTAAALRHLLAFMDGEQIDSDSGLPHIAHAATSLLFILELDGQADDFNTFERLDPREAYAKTHVDNGVFTLFVKKNHAGPSMGTSKHPYKTMAEAEAAAEEDLSSRNVHIVVMR